MRQFHQHTLPNGLRLIHEPSTTNVVYCGYIVAAGTRNEDEPDSGMAHFCEHMTFKGTERRRSWHIRNGLERVGGDLNAFTNKEITVFYATVQREDFARAVDLLSDIVFHSVYPQREIDKEVEVIIDEIDSYNDSPAELIYDEFEEMLFQGHSLGRNILGSAQRLRDYTTADALRFTRRYYVPNNTTFFVLGQVDFNRVVRKVEKHTAHLQAIPVNSVMQQLPPYKASERNSCRDTHQAHVLIGNRGYSIIHPDRTALFLLNNILGGPGMNSLLNVSLREKRGLVYNVESNTFSYQDSGVWSVYFGCEESKVERCRSLVHRELETLCSTPLSDRTLQMAKRQLMGQILIAGDNFESYALAMGKVFALTATHRDVDKICQRICDVSAADLMRVAQDVFDPSLLTTLIYQ
ncbi:MAG: insulinase family protein [Bacteroidaceae bacterium]|nr:insulinase family protein [Bacteroidaceae bacterium]